MMRVAKAYGDRPEIYRAVAWAALLELSLPSMSDAKRQGFERRIVAGERIAPAEIKASAQSLFGVLTYGLGMYFGTELAGWLNQHYTKEITDPATGVTTKVTDWRRFWLVPCVGALICLALFVVFF